MGSQVETIGSSQVPTSACQVRCAGQFACVATHDSHSTDRRDSTITEDACQHALGAGPYGVETTYTHSSRAGQDRVRLRLVATACAWFPGNRQ